MAQLTVRRHTFTFSPTRDSFNRRATRFQNNIFSSLRKLGLTQDDIDCELQPMAMKKAPAKVVWHYEGRRLYYSYNGQQRFADNLLIASKVIELEVAAVINGTKTKEEFITAFDEDDDIEEQRLQARELLGVDPESRDLDDINKRYRKLSKSHHPDMDGGSDETFKELNKAHKILKRELE